jgi:hypothetical protein
MSPKQHAIDLEEIAPDQFLIHTPRVKMFLKDEGDIAGRLFTLTTWRREGLLARLRARGFVVQTLADRIERLPALPEPPTLGEAQWRPLVHAAERFSMFGTEHLRWEPIADEERGGARGVMLRGGAVLRRRKGRGPAAFYLAVAEPASVGLRALDETTALLTGYAQAATHGARLVAHPENDHFRLPEVELPAPHRALLRRIAASDDMFVVARPSWPLAQELFAHLGVRLTTPQGRPAGSPLQ